MAKKILIVGGSYFVGRVFTLLAAKKEEFELHVLNRGNHPFHNRAITQYTSDRHDAGRLASVLPREEWDAVVDFCAYEPGDAASLLHALRGPVTQYVLISTCSVYLSSAPSPKSEDSPIRAAGGDDPGAVYAWKKVRLEKEAKTACKTSGTALTVFRPSFIYGPFNYAPREPWYFDRILRGLPIPHPVDATGRFSFVYVKDVAAAIMASVGKAAAYDEVFNLAAPEEVDYPMLLDAIEQAHGAALPLQGITVAQADAKGFPLPFPLDGEELFTGDKAARRLALSYTPFSAGMKESYDIYRHAHEG